MIVDAVRAESSRFNHPLLLIHGLWTGAWIWRQLASHLAHRGWDAWAPSFLDEGVAPDAGTRIGLLVELCGTLPAPPVLIAHDAGVGIAAALAREIPVPAMVSLAPLLDLSGALTRPQLWSAFFQRRVPPPRGRLGADAFRGLASDDVGRLRPDSGKIVRALVAGRQRIAERPMPAGLVIASADDPVAPAASAERLARRLDWSFDLHESTGHFLMLGPGAERFADRVHRWLVRAIGADLLAWIDEEEGEE